MSHDYNNRQNIWPSTLEYIMIIIFKLKNSDQRYIIY